MPLDAGLKFLVLIEFEKEGVPLSVSKKTQGGDAATKIIRVSSTCRGRRFLGKGSFLVSLQNQKLSH